jgi:hypothetical protein
MEENLYEYFNDGKGCSLMEENQQGFWTKSYGRSAFICFCISGATMASANNSPETILPILVNDAANIGLGGFVIAAIVREVRRRRNQDNPQY